MMNFNENPSLGVDEAALKFRRIVKIKWDLKKVPHALIFGGTGSGKTYCLKSILGSISGTVPRASVTVCDYKAEDFDFLEGCRNYYSYDSCLDGLRKFYETFEKRHRREDMSRDFCLLVFDEFAAFLTNLDKKEAEEAKNILSTLLMLGRAFNVHVIVAQQRADAKYFDTARDNFSVIIAMGNISKESVHMFFNDYKEDIRHDKKQGTGHILIDGEGLKHIIVPQVRNMESLHFAIRRVTDRLSLVRPRKSP